MILDLPLPMQLEVRIYRCRTCRDRGLPSDYPDSLSDIKRVVPTVLMYEDKKEGTVFATKQFLLHVTNQLFSLLCVRAVRCALADYYYSN